MTASFIVPFWRAGRLPSLLRGNSGRRRNVSLRAYRDDDEFRRNERSDSFASSREPWLESLDAPAAHSTTARRLAAEGSLMGLRRASRFPVRITASRCAR